MFAKNKDYFPYALANYFTNNSRWQARLLSSQRFQDLSRKLKRYKNELLELVPEERRVKVAAILNKIDETSAHLSGISIDEVAIEGLRAGLELGEPFYGGKSLKTPNVNEYLIHLTMNF
ncbi:MAG: hypothetical protein GX262_02315 [Clostridia bacterium]|nr:hypothetical protein [Clostridia bacterium]